MGASWTAPDGRDTVLLGAALEAQPLVAARFAAEPAKAAVPFLSSALVRVHELWNSLDRVGAQLLYLCKLRGGATRDAALADASDLDPGALDRAAHLLQLDGLATLDTDGRLQVLPALDAAMHLSQPRLADLTVLATNDQLTVACHTLGLEPGRRKAEHIAVLSAALSDRDTILRALSSLPATAVELFEIVVAATLAGAVEATPGGAVPSVIRTWDLPEHLAASKHRYNRGAGDTPLDLLCDRQLLGSHWGRTEVWVWAETLVALTGALFPSWRPAPTPEPQPLSPAAPRAATVVHALDDLVGYVAANPPIGKRSGDQLPPVKHWRAAATALRIDAPLAILLGGLAVEVGLIVPVELPPKGRGRNAVYDVQWFPEPGRAAVAAGTPLAQRWVELLTCWLDPDVAYSDQESSERRLLLAGLRSLPAGHGVAASELGPWLQDRHQLLSSHVVDDHLAQLILIGMVDVDGGVVGLSPAGRAACEDLEAVAELLGGGSDHFVVQPDHTIIAPADLRAELVAQLQRIADLESEGGASVFRLSAAKIAREAVKSDAATLVAFLHEYSSVPVPPTIERFLHDSVASVSPLTVQAAGCVLTGADAVALANAARIKAAKLTVVAPGVAVSPLPEAKVIEVLMGKGIVLTNGSRSAAPAASPGRSTGKAGSAASPAGAAALGPAAGALAPDWLVRYRTPETPLPPPAPLRIGAPADRLGGLAAHLAASAERPKGNGKGRPRPTDT